MKRNYLLGTVGLILLTFFTLYYVRQPSNPINKKYSDLPENWEMTYENIRLSLFDNYELIKPGYYDYKNIGKLVGPKKELDPLFSAWDGLSLGGIIISDKNNMMFTKFATDSAEVIWYSYGDSIEILKKNKFVVKQIIKGKDNWFYIRTVFP
jgi:hypothetical protein